MSVVSLVNNYWLCLILFGVRWGSTADDSGRGHSEPTLLLGHHPNGWGIVPTQRFCFLFRVKICGRVADLLLAAFHTDDAVRNKILLLL